MKYKDRLLACLHKLYRSDPWVGALFESIGIKLGEFGSAAQDMERQIFFDLAAEKDVLDYERELALAPGAGAAWEDRRAAIEAKWKSGGKVDKYLLQSVADSWQRGVIDVDFAEGKIKISIVGEYGIPNDLAGLEKAIEEVKPAHLAIYYVFQYYLIREIHGLMTLAELEKQQLHKFAGGGM